MTDSFTESVRQELASLEPGGSGAVTAELAALLRLAASLHLADGGLRLELVTASGATARRALRLLPLAGADAEEIRVAEPAGVRTRSTYLLALAASADEVARRCGILDADGRPVRQVPGQLLDGPEARAAYLRGATLAGGSFSTPGRPPHFELDARDEELAAGLVQLLAGVAGVAGRVTSGRRGPRVVVKSGAAIGEALVSLGASSAFLQWDDQRLRRQVRAQATRLANADAANLRRTTTAAVAAVREVERAVEVLGWGALPEDLRGVALVRLANPAASLGELGALLEPPVSKSVVHRRLARLTRLARDADAE